MKIKGWSCGFTADLYEGGTFNIHFYDRYGEKTQTIDDIIAFLKKFKETTMLIKDKIDDEEGETE